MKMQSPRFQEQKGRRKVSGRSMGHTLPGMLGTSQKGVPRCQTSLPKLPIKYEIHERIPYCWINFCFLLQLCGDFIPMLLNDSGSSVNFHGSFLYVGHSMLSCMVSQNTGFLNFSLINILKMFMGFAYMYVHAHVYAFVPA